LVVLLVNSNKIVSIPMHNWGMSLTSLQTFDMTDNAFDIATNEAIAKHGSLQLLRKIDAALALTRRLTRASTYVVKAGAHPSPKSHDDTIFV
jgi:hypothetical protein